MINKLLIALDGSNHALKTVDYASEIAASLKARVIILNVVKTPASDIASVALIVMA